MKKILFLTIWIIILITGQAFAATYYVDKNHNITSDTNIGTENCTENFPWSTIQHAANKVAAGNIVFVKPGEYDERVTINRAGENGNKTIFKSLPQKSLPAV